MGRRIVQVNIYDLFIFLHLCYTSIFKKLIYYFKKNNYTYICHGAEFCDILALFQNKVSATFILGDESSHCAFPGGKKIFSEVSQKAVYYFYK